MTKSVLGHFQRKEQGTKCALYQFTICEFSLATFIHSKTNRDLLLYTFVLYDPIKRRCEKAKIMRKNVVVVIVASTKSNKYRKHYTCSIPNVIHSHSSIFSC